MDAESLTDSLISELISEPKEVQNPKARGSTVRGAFTRIYRLRSTESNRVYEILIRQNTRVPDDFSCVFRYIPPSGKAIIIRRYNGSSHAHKNPIEKQKFSYQCHIHQITERYIAINRKNEHYAEPTSRYTDVNGALSCLLKDCSVSGLEAPGDIQDMYGD